MEQEEDYKRLKVILGELEQCSLRGDHLEKVKASVKKSIEIEFTKCMNALQLRKQYLLNEVEVAFKIAKKIVVTEEPVIMSALKGCKQLRQAGESSYNTSANAALNMWKSAEYLKPDTTNLKLISLDFPPSLSEDILTHGSIVTTSERSLFSYAGTVTTLAGSSFGNIDGKGLKAKFASPYFGCFNTTDNCYYLSDTVNNTIRKVDPLGEVTTFAAKFDDEQLARPLGICYYQQENCFFVCSETHHSIKKITATGTITTFAGSGKSGSSDGVDTEARFNYPRGITIDQRTGSLFVSDIGNHMIRKISPEGEVSTLAGAGTHGYSDGLEKSAIFNCPNGLCYSERDNSLVICDLGNNKLRKLDLRNGETSTICDLKSPMGVACTPNGSLIVSSTCTNTLFLVAQREGTYEVTPLAGSGTQGKEDGPPLACQFIYPAGITFDAGTNSCFVVDQGNHRIRKFTLI